MVKGKDQQPRALTDEILMRYKTAGNYSLEEMSDELNTGVGKIREAVKDLNSRGFGYRLDDTSLVTRTNTIIPPTDAIDHKGMFDGQHIKFGLVGDNHAGSTKERPDILSEIYHVFKKEGVKHVYHAGDWIDGVGVYKGQENEVKVYGTDAQVDHVVATYPREKGIKTHGITGNHDLRAFEHGGADPMRIIESKRPDIEYLGQMQATVELAEGVEMELLHPAGSQSYAKSYKLQRLIDNRPVQDRPDILAIGHYHTSFYMDHAGVQAIQVPSTKEHGMFEKRLGLSGEMGAWMVEMTVRDGDIVRFKPELLRVDGNRVHIKAQG